MTTRTGPHASRGAIVATIVLIATILAMPLARPLFHAAFPELRQPVYARASFVTLILAHLRLVVGATAIAAAIGMATGLFVKSAAGRPFASLAATIATIGQTFPPVAVLALAVPLLGYGAAPTVAALILYATLPILEATLAGLGAVPVGARDAARGLGFSVGAVLLRVDIPLAAPIVLTGLRNATIINIGTATIGSSVGALSLGSPILEGLSASNPAYVIQGSIIVALLAIATDRWFDVLEAIATGVSNRGG